MTSPSGKSVKNYGLISSVEELAGYVERLLSGAGPIGLDIETGYHGPPRESFSLNPEVGLVAGWSFTNSLDWARYVPVGHDLGPNLDLRDSTRQLWRLCRTGRAVIHNAKFELRFLSKLFREVLSGDPEFGHEVSSGFDGRFQPGYFPVFSDTMVEAYTLAEYQSFALKFLVQEIFGHRMTELYELFPDLPKNKRKTLRFNILELSPKVVEYACEDALWCLALHYRHYDKVRDRLLYKVDSEVIYVLCEMEDVGIRYDWGYMARYAALGRAFMDKLSVDIQAELSALTGSSVQVNLASPAQVADVLYGKLSLKPTRFTSGSRNKPASQRKPSTDAQALNTLAKKHPVVNRILQWKELGKLLGTYLDKYEKKFGFAPDGMVHSNHMQCAVITGRFAVDASPYQQCLPGDYQCLTPDGWVRLDSLPDGVAVAGYFPDGSLEFVVPSEVVRSPYEGEMVSLSSSEGGDWLYTPNHRMVYRRRREKHPPSEIREMSAEEWERRLLAKRPLPQGLRLGGYLVPKAGRVREGKILSVEERDQLRLAIAAQADGSKTAGHQYDFSVYRESKVLALRDLGVNLVAVSGDSDLVRHRGRVPCALVDEWLDGTKEKNFRADRILTLSADDLRWFVHEVMQWDGDSTRGATYGQKNLRRASVDIVQAAAILCGYTTSLYERPEYDAVAVNIWDRTEKEAGWQTPSRVPSPGMVYCVTVPSGMFLVRNPQGKVQMTGNSPKKYHYELASGEEFVFNFRNAIVAPEGYYILGFDYGQAELRGIAGEAQERALLEAFESGVDVHKKTASLMLRLPLDQIGEKQRDIGKTLNFALGYGMQVKSLSERLGLSVDEAQVLFDQYMAAYPALGLWKKRQEDYGRAHGYVTSKFGRRLPIWEYQSTERWIREKGDRGCVNYPIQGGATGDYPRIAMVRARKAIRAAGLQDKVKMVMNIHDALEFYVHRSVPPQTVIELLEPAVVFPVPGWPMMAAEWHIGKKWGSLYKLAKDAGGTWVVKGEKAVPVAPVSPDSADLVPGDAEPLSYDREALRAALGPVRPLSPGKALPTPAPRGQESLRSETPATRSETPSTQGSETLSRTGAPSETPRAGTSETPTGGSSETNGGHPDESRKVIVELSEMPLESAFRRFLAELESAPGPNTVLLRTPEGELELDLPRGTRLGPGDKAKISMALGGARVYYEQSDIPTETIMSGIQL